MATATVTTDLIEITDCDSTTSSGTWSGVTVSVVTSDPSPIEGTGCLGGIFKSTTDASNDSFFAPTSGIDLSGKHLRFKLFTSLKAVLKTQAEGGIDLSLYDGSNTAYYHVSGSDKYLGGWETLVLDCDRTPDSGTQPTVSSLTNIGIIFRLNAAAKNVQTAWFDWISYGDGIKATGGTSGDEITFDDIDTQDVYYGILEKINGIFRLKGKLQIGTDSGTSTTYFSDTGQILIFDDLLVDDSLYELKVVGNSIGTTVVDMSGNFITSEANPYVITMTDSTYVSSITIDGTIFQNATAGVNLSTCVTGDGTVFDGCGMITPLAATLSNVTIKNSTDTSALSFPSTNNLSNLTFISSGTGHAILLTATGTISISGYTFTGYATTDGSTGNEVIYNNSGGAVTINVSDITGTISVRNSTGSTTTVQTSISITINVTDESNTDLETAYVYLVDAGSTEVMNTTTNSSGIASGSYAGSQTSGTLRVRKYGYKPYTGAVPLSSAVSQTIVLVADPVQDASPQDLSTYYTISTAASTITSVGTATYTVKEYFKWLANTFAAAAYMQYTYPMAASTDTVFNFTNSWAFGTPASDYKYLKTGSIASSDENSLWSCIYTLGTLVSGTTLDVYQNDTEQTPAWWSSGQIDILVLVKSGGTLIDSGNITVLARKYSTLYDHYVIDASDGGKNPVPLSTSNDLNNTTAEATVGAYSGITITFGYTSQDLANGNGSQPYDVSIDCGGLTIAQVYEYLKYVTRTGSTTTLNGANGEYYKAVGDVRFTYTTVSGTMAEGNTLTDTTSGATGYITSIITASNTIVITRTHGTFTNGDSIEDSGGATGTINSVPEDITQSKQAPFGTFAGGKFFGARGVWIENMDSDDATKFQLIDSTGTTQNPPSTIGITITVQDLTDASVIEGANVLLWATDDSNFFYQASVSITGSGTTATVSHTAHGMTTGDYVIIRGVENDDDYNGVFQVTVTGTDEYTYTTTETLGSSPATGTSITATFAFLSGATNGSGVITDTRDDISVDQPVSGWIRYYPDSTEEGIHHYQQGTISGTISSTAGLSLTIQLARDD